MSSAVSSISQTQVHATTQPKAVRPPVQQPQPHAVPTDTVQISAAAKALQEATETSVQTARESASGDSQAARLLARETAAKAHR